MEFFVGRDSNVHESLVWNCHSTKLCAVTWEDLLTLVNLCLCNLLLPLFHGCVYLTENLRLIGVIHEFGIVLCVVIKAVLEEGIGRLL